MTTIGQQELVTDIVIASPSAGSGSAYVAVEHPASGFALAGAAALVGAGGETVALTGVSATPFVLSGADIRSAIADEEIYGDRFASSEYRRELAAVVAERALATARDRAKGDI
jgi:carbon-monoxide dehydrogenase medium subunit